LTDALFARTRTSFGTSQTVYFSFIDRHVSIKETLLTCFMLFPIMEHKIGIDLTVSSKLKKPSKHV